jgi:Bacterial protein of unknown function (DUF885)
LAGAGRARVMADATASNNSGAPSSHPRRFPKAKAMTQYDTERRKDRRGDKFKLRTIGWRQIRRPPSVEAGIAAHQALGQRSEQVRCAPGGRHIPRLSYIRSRVVRRTALRAAFGACLPLDESPRVHRGRDVPRRAGRAALLVQGAQPLVEAYVDRIAVCPGEMLSYGFGEREFTSLRREAEAALGNKFDIKAFHERVLAQAVPLPMLREVVTRWIRETPSERR